jgi:predicted methyltransferase
MDMSNRLKKIFTVASLALLVSCGKAETPAAETGAGMQDKAVTASIYDSAVGNPGRTDADRARDAGRKPAQVLEFMGITPGMDVLDMFSGGGYYTEILSNIVGPEGSVIAHSNQAYAQFVGEEATNRYANGRLPNVKILMAENDALEMPDEAFDAVMMILAYHDIYYVDPDNGWPKIDGPALVAQLFEALRPGGMLAVVDHYATSGSPPESGTTLHRIDPQIVIDELQSAGFVLEAQSDLLRNKEDDHSLNMSAPEIRGKTDRFVMRFRKPGQAT